MADMLDDAEATTNLLFQEAIRKRHKVPEKTGFCLVCEAPTDGAFCSRECREDYEHLEKMKAIKGK